LPRRQASSAEEDSCAPGEERGEDSLAGEEDEEDSFPHDSASRQRQPTFGKEDSSGSFGGSFEAASEGTEKGGGDDENPSFSE